MKIAFVVSGNGYGHLKRVCTVIEEIFKADPHTHILVTGAFTHIRMLETWGYAELFKSFPFSFVDTGLVHSLKAVLPDNYSFDAYIRSFSATRERLQAYAPDVIVSDNLAGMLNDFPQTILMGSFLWSDTLVSKFPENPEIEKICRYEDILLKRISPVMLGIEDMVMPYVRQKTAFKGLPWFCKKILEKKPAKKTNKIVLLTGGGTQIAMNKLLAIAKSIITHKDFHVSLDQALYRKADESWKQGVSLFDFSEASFASLDWIVCRPGIGILTDAVQYELPVLVLDENDKEIRFNCDRVEQMGIGLRAGNADEVREQLEIEQSRFRERLTERKTGGAALAAQYILNS